MPGIYKFKTSRLALWALLLARLSIPVAILSFLLMRFGGLHPSLAIYCFAASVALALLSILVSLAAFPTIWFDGQIGGMRLWGTFLRSLFVLLPALAFAYFYFSRPAFSDLSTNPIDPPEFVEAWKLRGDNDNSLESASLAEREKQALAYPSLNSKKIEQPIELVHLLVLDELKKQNWELLRISDYRDSVDGSDFEATTRSVITGLRYAMSVRLRPDGEEASILDMRSASLWGPHDFGINAARIMNFMASVDNRLEGGIKHFELQIEEEERQRRLERGPIPRAKPLNP
ncbi:DUF1499 domain-containing protein [Cohaesibacter celericrescens]|uniref:DUF1499 domain-containing protein n=1 Tax=Cohaesibacter celericrescens TaxID=2067669 RepID=A0A2N5XV64_9HYPH|nr:DUF1499 domain-containing protein [Cohaesibacter celericrescens]PLW78384.1 hypothetical protein C0081_04630 [Cohaesibacter celericrescens]